MRGVATSFDVPLSRCALMRGARFPFRSVRKIPDIATALLDGRVAISACVHASRPPLKMLSFFGAVRKTQKPEAKPLVA